MTSIANVPRRRALTAARTAVSMLRAQPFSIGTATAVLVLGMLQHSLFATPVDLLRQTATGFEPVAEQGQWWTLLTWTLFAPDTATLAVDVAAILVLLGAAERLLGTWRTALAYVVTGVAGAVAGISLQLLGSGSGEFWTRSTVESIGLNPLAPIAGALMAASGSASALWRRRIRVLTLMLALVLLLYSGQPTDLYLLLSAVGGLALGVVLRREKKILRWVRGSQHEIRVMMATVVAITAAGPVVALATGSHFGPLAPIAQLLLEQAPHMPELARCEALHVTDSCVRVLTLERAANPGAVVVSAAPLILLLVAAYGMLRGRRFAVGVAAVVNLLLGALGLFYFGILPVSGLPFVIAAPTGTHWEVTLGLSLATLIPLGLGIALILLRGNFRVLPSRRHTRVFLVVVSGVAVVLTAAYIVGGLALHDTAFTRAVGLRTLLGDVLERFIPIGFLRHESVEFLPTTPMGALLYFGIGPAFWVVLVGATVWVLGEQRSRKPQGTMAQVRQRLNEGGGDSLSFLATWPGNAHWFDPLSRAVITYRVVGRVALTIGGPFSVTGSKEPALSRFAQFCTDNGWLPVFYSIDSKHEGFFRSIGWHTMVIAEETVLRPATFEMAGKKWQDVRTSINRAQRAGVRAVWTSYAALPLAHATQLTEISEQWMASKGLPEMGFTLGGIDELRDPAVRLMVALGEDGVVHGVTSWLPTFRDARVIGWTLDFMRRRPDSFNGVMEFLIAETALRMRDENVEFLSLSGAPLAHTAATVPDGGIERILDYISGTLEPAYGFRSLLNFKRKFQPEFHPLVMAYPDPAALPVIGLALTRAYLPRLSLKNAAALARGKI
ncbi:hypothetical protein HMPREF1529_02516 [Microbacterium sp. oral taxon 186 str. F0373]|uniref:bifunctional lysylphosphatidylglycerol flippase/synthetase MprF n=1 Tax=Microbacterium sp. oral taxon 186 TaxID=712383 RepID=UPI00034E61AB|nr:rhomboid family intramembrane serine protease [Microbacterium sp. oral taxon 186]EPD83148.1 hypothetical protein HMPREF1529_02516 [Microbacterium sp. oral taxon 186 str. F0373]